MPAARASRHERFLRLLQRNADSIVEAGLGRVRIEDEYLSGESIILDGKRLLNFGSCAYLGVNLDPRLKQGAIKAIERFGPSFSSSAAYASVGLYDELEERLRLIFDGPVVAFPTTTLGHLSALPVLVGEGDVALVDSQAHSSVHLATGVLQSKGVDVRLVPHNDLAALDRALDELTPVHRSVWYLADGVYSMLGDTAPVKAIVARLDRYENLHAYLDDAHGFGWEGLHGRGYVLNQVPMHERMVVAGSLSKSFGSGGAAIALPNEEMARRVQMLSGPLIFGGPIHPAELGAAVASADLHLSPEHSELRAAMADQIATVRSAALELELPVASHESTPIWFARIGQTDRAIAVAQRLMHDGYYVNIAAFPAVALGQSGIRFTHTLYHDSSQVVGMMESMARHIEDVVGVVEAPVQADILIDLTDSAMAESLAAQSD